MDPEAAKVLNGLIKTDVVLGGLTEGLDLFSSGSVSSSYDIEEKVTSDCISEAQEAFGIALEDLPKHIHDKREMFAEVVRLRLAEG